jgi:hypothetical protein
MTPQDPQNVPGHPTQPPAANQAAEGSAPPPEEAEPRSFEPGRTAPEGEGGGAMSGRGQEAPGEPRGSPSAGAQAAGSPPQSAQVADLPGGLASPLQPGGTTPGGGPGANQGSIGTGGGSTGGKPSGSLKRDGA